MPQIHTKSIEREASRIDKDEKGVDEVLRQLADEKMTMIIVTHEIEFARKVADRVIFMDGGVIVEQGKPEDVIDNPSNERTKAFLQKMEK